MSGKSNSDDIFSVERLRQLVELMKEHDLGEIDLQQDKQKIRLARTGACQPVISYAAPPAVAPTAAAASGSSPAAEAKEADGPHIVTIKSPMVGTFYARPNPESKDFVSVGSSVQGDTVVCIIEAMKVFNEIPAEITGKVVAVLVKNEEPVDFGKPLFKIDTRG